MGVRVVEYAGRNCRSVASNAHLGRHNPLPRQHVGHFNHHKIFGPRGTLRYNAPPMHWARKQQNAVRSRYGRCFVPCDSQGAPCISGVPEKPYVQWETTKVLCVLQCRSSVSRHVCSGQPSLLSEETASDCSAELSIF